MLALGFMFEHIVNDEHSNFENLPDKEKLQKIEVEFFHILDELEMIEYIFVLNQNEINATEHTNSQSIILNISKSVSSPLYEFHFMVKALCIVKHDSQFRNKPNETKLDSI